MIKKCILLIRTDKNLSAKKKQYPRCKQIVQRVLKKMKELLSKAAELQYTVDRKETKAFYDDA